MVDASKKPEAEKKAVVAPKQRYFVPELGKTVEAKNLDEVADIVKKESANKGEKTK
jgi:hypothetical protein